jgi:uncharacterized protein (TIGR02246 family)
MQNDEEAIREVVATWFSASRAGDTEKVLSLMTDDVVFLVPGKPPMRGKGAFAAALAAMKPFDMDASSTIEEIKVSGDWAYMWSNLSVIMTPKNGGAAVKRAGPTLSILRKESGKWLMARDANMLSA